MAKVQDLAAEVLCFSSATNFTITWLYEDGTPVSDARGLEAFGISQENGLLRIYPADTLLSGNNGSLRLRCRERVDGVTTIIDVTLVQGKHTCMRIIVWILLPAGHIVLIVSRSHTSRCGESLVKCYTSEVSQGPNYHTIASLWHYVVLRWRIRGNTRKKIIMRNCELAFC